MGDIRDDEQLKVVTNYIREGPDRCTLALGTGIGKSKVTIDILKHKLPKKVLLLVNSTLLRDDSWKQEFHKFNFGEYYDNNVETATYQLVYKWKAEDKDLTDYFIVADEVDFAADVPELSKFFYEFPDIPVLGLTGFITGSKKEWFAEQLPVFATITANEAQNKGILNNVHFVFVKYDLSKNPNDVLVEYTQGGAKKSFRQSENKAYDYQQHQVQKLIIAKEVNNSSFLKQEIDYEVYLKQGSSLDYLIDLAIRKRAELMLKSPSAATMAKKLIKHLLKTDPLHKIVVFSKRTKQSAEICGLEMVYNGAVTPAKAKKNFEAFQEGEIRVLGTCDKLNRGANVKNLNTAIMESFYGSDTQAVQRLGRLMRLSPDELATVYVFLPYYMRSTTKDGLDTYVSTPTQQVKWAEKMLKSTTIKSSAVWDYRTVKD